MREKMLKLISVKSIVTIILTIVFAALSLCGKVSAEQFLVIFSTVIAFYFGTQHEKKTPPETAFPASTEESVPFDENVYINKADGSESI